MSKQFLIGGTIIDDESQQWALEDVRPAQVKAFLANLEPSDTAEFLITSPGGSVTAGLAIANLIRAAREAGHSCKAHVIGIAASMASVITCACDEIDIDESAFMMIHNPWTVAQGDADDLRKSADVLDKMRDSILSFYRSKFEKTDDEIKALMDAETWFTGKESAEYGFKANVITSEEPLKAAACARELPVFGRMPEAAAKFFVVGKHEEEPATVTQADGSEPADEVAEPAPAVEPAPAEPVAEPVPAAEPVAEPVAEPAPAPSVDEIVKERLAKAMQSRDREINALKEQLATDQRAAVDTMAKLENDFKDKLEAKDKELINARAEITRLAEALDLARKEVKEEQTKVSNLSADLSDKTLALAQLNAAVNTPKAVVKERTYEEIVSDPKSTPQEKIEAARKEVARRNRQ